MASISTLVSRLLWDRSMRSQPVWLNEIRAVAQTDADVAKAWKQADDLGVEIRGKLSYQEWKALERINSTR